MLGARLKESVTTGNCPWWLTVMGTEVICTVVKAESGTWLPEAKMAEEAGVLPKTLLEAEPVALLEPPAEEDPGVELTGPREIALLLEPPATTPVPPEVEPMPVRM